VYFHREAIKDSIFNENVTELINLKHTASSFKGAEGYTTKFNDIINAPNQQSHSCTNRFLKSLYLGNTQDKMYDTIMDQNTTPQMTLQELQAAVLKKHLQSMGKKEMEPQLTLINSLNVHV